MIRNIFKNIRFWQFIGKMSPTSILIIKEDGNIVYKNEIFSNLVDSNYAHLSDYMNKTCLKKFNDNIKKSVLLNKIVSDDINIKIENNKLHFILYLFPIRKDNFALILVNTTNIINKNKMYENIINTVADPIFVKNEQHQYMYVNEAFSKWERYSPEEILVKKSVDFLTKKESDVFCQINRKTFRSEKVTVNEKKFIDKVHGARIISTKKAIFKTETGDKILVGIIKDITEVKEAREYLRNYSKNLEIQVKKRTKELENNKNNLEKVVEKLKSLNSDLDCFAHICCHELREPLRTISSFSQLTINDYASGNIKNISSFLKIIYDVSLKMDKIIHSILEYSTNGFRTNSMKLFSAGEVINEVLTILSPQIQERKAIITCDNMPNIYADRLQIFQLFQNLINNAIKFCDSSKTPSISISVNQKNNRVDFKIKDNGIGISKIYHKEIFLPFRKFHSRSEGSQHGIGLNLCKKIVENHGGSIKMSSRENIGTTFKITIPSQEIK